jgi:nitric oxide synthase-interacting protein
VQYLLTKNGELKRERKEYERKRLEVENRRAQWEEANRQKELERFVRKDQGAMAESSVALVVRKDVGDNAATAARGVTTSSTSAKPPTREENSLKQVSYWLASSQPIHRKGQVDTADGEFDYQKELEALPPPPPERPPSPMTGEPLKLKQLIPLHLLREGDDEKSSSKANSSTGKVLCAVSHKQITTQPTVCIKTTGQVMLKSVYEELAKPTMVCPVTSKKFKEGDVLELIRGKSGFAASGTVVATKYNPTLT